MSDAFRKPRADSVLASQPEHILAELDDYAASHTIAETLAWLEADRAIETSAGALSNHLRKRRLITLRLRMQEGAATAEEFAEDAARLNGGKADDMLFAALRTKIQDLMAESNASPKDIRTLLQLIIQARKTDHDARRIALLEKKAALADNAENLAKDATLTPAEKATRLKALFGMG